MSKRFEQVKCYYDKGYWTKEMVYNAVVKGWITEEEYKEIAGETHDGLDRNTG